MGSIACSPEEPGITLGRLYLPVFKEKMSIYTWINWMNLQHDYKKGLNSYLSHNLDTALVGTFISLREMVEDNCFTPI